MYGVGGQGYVGSRVVDAAIMEGADPVVISRTGLPRLDRASIAWPDFEALLHEQSGPPVVVWLLDGAKHAETERLGELLSWAPAEAYIALVSTCTVYGDRHGDLCTEQTPLDLVMPHARVKAECEGMLADSRLRGVQQLPDRVMNGVNSVAARRRALTRNPVDTSRPANWASNFAARP